MSWTKGQIVEDAYNELAIAGWVYDLDESERQWGGQRLDLLLADWDARGIHLGYALAATPDAVDLDADSGIPIGAIRGVVLNLAKSLASGKGKALPPQTLADARQALDAIRGKAFAPREQQLPNTLQRGQGSKHWRTLNRPYMPRPDTTSPQLDEGGGLTFPE